MSKTSCFSKVRCISPPSDQHIHVYTLYRPGLNSASQHYEFTKRQLHHRFPLVHRFSDLSCCKLQPLVRSINRNKVLLLLSISFWDAFYIGLFCDSWPRKEAESNSGPLKQENWAPKEWDLSLNAPFYKDISQSDRNWSQESKLYMLSKIYISCFQ